MRENIAVSVIVPIYNVEKYIKKCIDSLLNQTFINYEIILVDDGSPDNCPKIADDYAKAYPEIITTLHKENGGVGDARNYGIEHTKGEYILILDSDDYVEPNMLEELYNNAVKFKSDIVLCGFKCVNESGNIISVNYEDIPENQVMTLQKNKEILLTNPAPWNKLYKRSLFIENKDIRYPKGIWYEDIRVTLKLLKTAKVISYVNKPLYNYLWREGSQTNNKNCDRNSEIIDAFEDILSYFKYTNSYEEYREELEFLVITHIYLAASVRVLNIDKNHRLLKVFRDYLEENFPDWRSNKYLKNLDKNKKLILKLLNLKGYSIIKGIFLVKNQLKK